MDPKTTESINGFLGLVVEVMVFVLTFGFVVYLVQLLGEMLCVCLGSVCRAELNQLKATRNERKHEKAQGKDRTFILDFSLFSLIELESKSKSQIKEALFYFQINHTDLAKYIFDKD